MRFIALLTFLAGTLVAQAQERRDVLLIDRVHAQNELSMPQRGSSMSAVEQRFGEPEIRHNAVGAPPITKWTYADFTVYFEGQWVIDSVANAMSPEEQRVPPPDVRNRGLSDH